MTDPVSAGSPKVASFNATAISASDYFSKITTVIPKNGVNGKDSKKVEPTSKNDEASIYPPIDSTVRVATSMMEVGQGLLSLQKCLCSSGTQTSRHGSALSQTLRE